MLSRPEAPSASMACEMTVEEYDIARILILFIQYGQLPVVYLYYSVFKGFSVFEKILCKEMVSDFFTSVV